MIGEVDTRGVRHLVWCFTALGMVVLLAAGLLKLADFPMFIETISAWRSLPPWIKATASIMVPIAEVTIAGCWLLGLGRRRCAILALATIILFSMGYAWEWIAHGAPRCGCLGALAGRMTFLEDARSVLIRNGLLAGVFGAAVCASPRTASREPSRQSARPIVASRGFSLSEVLVAIALVGMLVVLILPSLSGVRRSGRVTVSLSNLRQHVTTVTAYAGEYRDLFPYLTDPGATWSVIRCDSAGIAVTSMYFDAAERWWLGLADGYYNGIWNSPAFRSPLEPPGVTGGSYVLSCTTFALPEYYVSEEHRAPPAQLRPVSLTSVLYPSAKGVLTDASCFRVYDGSYNRNAVRFQAALADGHARTFDAAQHLGPQFGPGDGPYMDFGAHWPWWVPMTHTEGGVRGRDVR